MNGLKYIFPGNSKLWILIFILSFMAVNCQNGCGCNGCTTSVIVDQESSDKKVDGIDIEITASKNRVTNRKLRLGEEITVDKTVWFSIDYYLEIENRPKIKNICEYEVPENAEMEKALDKFSIKFSSDKQHFAVGLDNKVYDFFHLLKNGVPFSSGCYYIQDSNYTFMRTAMLDMDHINWSVFPTSDELFNQVIVPNNYSVFALNCNKENILNLLDDLPPGNQHEKVLIENWFCEIADLHFTETRVKQIIKVSPEWKKLALIQFLNCIDKSFYENDPVLQESLNRIVWIDDLIALNKADSLTFQKYFTSGFAGDYLVGRSKNIKKPVNKKIQLALLTKAKSVSTNFKRYPTDMSLENAIEILLINQEYNLLKTFINANVQADSIQDYFMDISSATIKKYEIYPKNLQVLLVKNYQKILQKPDLKLSSFDLTEVLEFLKDKISCSELKKLVELHKNNLYTFTMPNGC